MLDIQGITNYYQGRINYLEQKHHNQKKITDLLYDVSNIQRKYIDSLDIEDEKRYKKMKELVDEKLSEVADTLVEFLIQQNEEITKLQEDI